MLAEELATANSGDGTQLHLNAVAVWPSVSVAAPADGLAEIRTERGELIAAI